MKQNIDYTRVYGDVPPEFSACVQAALRRTHEEETPMKRMTLRTVLIAAVLAALVTVGVAATLSRTLDFFDRYYGGEFLTKQDPSIDPHSQSIVLDGVTFTLHDVVIAEGENTIDLYATGAISSEADVLMAWDDCTVTDPAGYALYGGGEYPTPAPDAPSYAEAAAARGLDRIRMVRCVPNGLLDEQGALLPGSVGYNNIPNTDGSVDFSIEVPGESDIPRQDAYRLSLYIAVQDVDLEGSPIGERQSMDWIVTVQPE